GKLTPKHGILTFKTPHKFHKLEDAYKDFEEHYGSEAIKCSLKASSKSLHGDVEKGQMIDMIYIPDLVEKQYLNCDLIHPDVRVSIIKKSTIVYIGYLYNLETSINCYGVKVGDNSIIAHNCR